jgi:hypothetical protein
MLKYEITEKDLSGFQDRCKHPKNSLWLFHHRDLLIIAFQKGLIIHFRTLSSFLNATSLIHLQSQRHFSLIEYYIFRDIN